MKKKLTAFFLSVVLFGALNTAHCVEPSSSGSSPAEGEEKQLTNAQADKAYQPHTQGQYISGSVKDEEKAGSQQKQLPDNQTDKATQDQLMNDRSNVIQLNLSAPDSPIERNHFANTQINNRDQKQQENQ